MPAGRADYFGTVSNLAARVAGLAAPGQISGGGQGGLPQGEGLAPKERHNHPAA